MRTLQAAEFTGCASAGNKTPLLALHGPGAAHNYLLTMQALAEDRPMIFYDQLGCGKAAPPPMSGSTPFSARWTSSRCAAHARSRHLLRPLLGTILADGFAARLRALKDDDGWPPLRRCRSY